MVCSHMKGTESIVIIIDCVESYSTLLFLKYYISMPVNVLENSVDDDQFLTL